MHLLTQEGAVLTSVVEPPTPEIVLTQYARLFKQQARRCLDKLPPSTTLDLDDLIQEGQIHAVMKVLPKFDPTRGSFMTVLHVSLQHRYRKIMRREWRHRKDVRGLTPERWAKVATEGGQGDVDALVDLCATARPVRRKSRQGYKVLVRDRYKFLRTPVPA